MLACFPTLNPDESFYSGCARYAERIAFPSHQYAVRVQFGHRVQRVAVNLPRHLGLFVGQLPPGHALTVDTIIEKHTDIPYYRTFNGGAWAARVKAVMVEERQKWGGFTVHSPRVLGRASSGPRLRFCLGCAEEDRQRFGETYWHRLHQIPGCVVCPTHHQVLLESSVPVYLRQPSEELITAEQAIRNSGETCLGLSITTKSHLVLLRIAQDVEWILNSAASMTQEEFGAGYRIALKDHGLLTAKGHFKRGVLFQNMVKAYGGDILSRLDCGRKGLFLRDLPEPSSFQVPLRHLLVIQLLGYTAESFSALCHNAVTKPTNEVTPPVKVDWVGLEPFGQGPWPCLNRAADHFQQPVVRRCCVHVDAQKRVTGEFCCACGYVFVRRGPDKCLEDRFRLGKVRQYGAVWDQQLKLLWENGSLSVVAKAKVLRVDYVTVKRQALRLGLTFPPGHRLVTLPPPYTQRPKPKGCHVISARNAILGAVQRYPGESRYFFHALLPGPYNLLWRRDRIWLLQHLPFSSIDWTERDHTVEQRIREGARRLYARSGRPVRITRQRILREVHLHRLPVSDRAQMSRAALALRELSETREALAVRRINWLSTQRQIADLPDRGAPTMIRKTLGLDASRSMRPVVAEAIDVAST